MLAIWNNRNYHPQPFRQAARRLLAKNKRISQIRPIKHIKKAV
ncbi:hypothetical protein HMPREF9120_02047 [Neisseria sp. oral taxon 020 str. F0370]|nr:hypothetical protein HMPREF9120_02047 [Neisseria sp. oral taxon 020 str. F0370]